MDNEQIKKEISVRLEIEREVRKQLQNIENRDTEPEKSRWQWLESKLVLLVIGALISGILVPTFQFTQEKIKWHRQNRYNSLERKLTSMHGSLKQFIDVHGLSAELYNLGSDALKSQSATPNQVQLEDWQNEFNLLRKRRIGQNAAFAATVFFFPKGSREQIRKDWNALLLSVQKLEALVEKILNNDSKDFIEVNGQQLAMNKIPVQLDVSLSEMNKTYNRVLKILRQQFQEVENESTKFR